MKGKTGTVSHNSNILLGSLAVKPTNANKNRRHTACYISIMIKKAATKSLQW